MQAHLSALVLAASEAIQSLLNGLRGLLGGEALTYRPEKHYMRGPRRK